eukprot:13370795-Alexandrium_andersonii.AAC.1
MSASLVGSEMCIRDRFSSSSARVSQRPPPSALRSRSSAPTARHSPKKPVSYTHLTLPTICSV